MYSALVQQRSNLNHPDEEEIWKMLWRLKIHEHLKILLWKLAWDILPTRGKIAERIEGSGEEETLCGLCNCAVEPSKYILLDCVYARILWRHSPWKMDSLVNA